MKNIRIIIVILLLVAFALAGLVGRCFYLQYFKTDEFQHQALRAQETIIYDKPYRGNILDCRGRVLAASNRIETLFADRNTIEDIDATAAILAPILGRSADQIATQIRTNTNPGYVKLQVEITAGQRSAFLSLRPRPKGVGIMADYKRHYPAGPLAVHVVGFTDANGIGQLGIEMQYDKKLRGSVGSHVFFLDAARRSVRIKEEKAAVTDGMGLILTLDSTIQEFARAALLKQYHDFQAESAVAIVMEPYTGEVLALVSLPDFEPDKIGTADRNTWRNRALTDPFEPGSIFKPIVATIALDSKAIAKSTVINCENGSYSGKGFGTIGEYNHHRYGMMTVREILVVSSNIGMAKIGQKMGKTMLYNGLRLFGMGQPTGIDLPGEGTGVLWPTKRWTGYSVTRIPYGQEISVTAMQIARAYCMIVNGGHPVRPYLLKSMITPDGNVIECKRPTVPPGFVVQPDIAKWVVEQPLTGVVVDDHGTGHNAALEKWQVFGKTGTANIANVGVKGFSENDYVASFAGGAPSEKPAVVVLVSVRKPNRKLGKGYTGGTVAAPVVREILDKTLTYMEQKGMIEPSKKTIIKKSGTAETTGGF